MRVRSPRPLLAVLVATLAVCMAPSLAEAQQWPPRIVADLHQGSSDPHALTEFGSALYFVADSTWASPGLWKTDGMSSTTPVFSFDPSSITRLTVWNGALYFAGNGGGYQGLELWRSDGTTAGTQLIADIDPNASGSPQNLTPSGRYLFFTANDGVRGTELWKTDGTPEGTSMVAEVNWSGGSDPHALTDFGGVLLFVANDGSHGDELWRTDGTPEGTSLVADINPGIAGSGITTIAVAEGHAFFAASDGVGGTELWVTNGGPNPGDTTRVADILPGPASSGPGDLTVIGSVLFFAADDGVFGRELWKLDAASGWPPALVADIQPGPTGSNPVHLRNVEGRLYFAADDGYSGAELWTAEATAGTASMVMDINPGPASSSPQFLTDVNGTLFFRASDAYTGPQLWSSHGTYAETNTFYTGSGNAPGPIEIVLAGGRLFFTFQDPYYGIELWTADNEQPVAATSPDQITEPGSAALVDAFGSYDPDGPFPRISYEWRDQDGALMGREAWLYVPVPAPSTREFTLIVRDFRGGRNEDRVRIGTAGRTPPAVTVTSPAQGEVLNVGLAYDIQWTATDEGSVAAVRVLVSTDGGLTFTPLPGCELPGTATSCTWTPPTVITKGRLKVEATDDHGDRGAQTVAFDVWGPPTGPQRLDITVRSLDGGSGTVGTQSQGTWLCTLFPGMPETSCPFFFDPGTLVAMDVFPDPGSTFAGWSGACTGSGPCSVRMNGSRQLTAVFRGPQVFDLTVTVDSVDNGAGGVHVFGPGSFNPCEGTPGTTQTCTFQYQQGTPLELWPNPFPDSTFVGWAGACTGTDPCRLTVEGPLQVAATFQGPQYVDLTVTAESVENGAGIVEIYDGHTGSWYRCDGVPGSSHTCTFSIRQGAYLALRASERWDSAFLGWSGACSGGPYELCDPATNQSLQVTATFRGPQTLTVQVDSQGGGSGHVQVEPYLSCENTPGAQAVCTFPFRPDTPLSLVATARPDSVFVGWGGACSGTGPCQVTMSAAATVTAVFALANRPPVANPGGPYSGVRTQPVLFDGSGSNDPDGDPLTYAWDFGDGSTGTGVAPSHAYAAIGAYTVTLVVSDGRLSSAPVSTAVTITNAPPQANAGPDQTVSHPALVILDGRASTDPDGSIAAYAWRQTAGPEVVLLAAGFPLAAFRAPQTHEPVTLEFELTVTDNDGAVSMDRVQVTVTP